MHLQQQFPKIDSRIKNGTWAQFSIHHRGPISKNSSYLKAAV